MQFFDANGNPLSGGKLYTYTAGGTSTPQATYTDAGGGTPNANPVVLNARGEADIWLGSSAYYMVLKDSSDVQIWTADNVTGQASVAALAASSGASLIGFIQSGTGTTTTTLQSVLREIPSVTHWGVVGDGVTDNTAAWAAVVASGKKRFLIPAGTYKGLLSLSGKTGFEFYGEGIGNTILKGMGTAANAVELKNITTRCKLSNLSIDGNSTTGAALYIASTATGSSDTGNLVFDMVSVSGAATGIRVNTASEIQFNQCIATGTSASGSIGLWATGTQSVNIEVIGGGFLKWEKAIKNTDVSGASESQIGLDGVSFGQNTVADIYTNFRSRWTMHKCFTEGSDRHIYCQATGSGTGGEFLINGLYINSITNADKYALYFLNPVRGILNGCTFSGDQRIYCDDYRTSIVSIGNNYQSTTPFAGLATGTELVTSGDVNASGPLSNNYAAKISKSATQSLTTGVAAAITFDTEAFDTQGFHSTSVSTDLFTIPTGGAGLYHIQYSICFDANATGLRQAVIWKNGSALAATRVSPAPAGEYTQISVSTIDVAAGGDTYQLQCLQTSGGALNVINATTGSIMRIGNRTAI